MTTMYKSPAGGLLEPLPLNFGPPVNLAAQGSTDATTSLISGKFTQITGSNGSTAISCILPSGQTGDVYLLYPTAASNAVTVFPPLGGSINNGTVSTGSFSMTAQTPYLAICVSALVWLVK